ncbi:MAG: hypothetical protein IH956_01925 [Chloroflexi bacterium]|nr:hypothetical protein [Chloroflexota bacterium]
MTETTSDSKTKTMFDCLSGLYDQGQLLLMDADRLMGERGWEPRHTSAPGQLSVSLSSPERWYARWAARFYMPTLPDENAASIDRLLFVSIHFASDRYSNLQTQVDDPLISAGRLLYHEPMDRKTTGETYDYWMCKYWFIGQPHDSLKGWRQGGQSKWFENLKRNETFVVPLYNVTSSEKLEELVIDPLVTA